MISNANLQFDKSDTFLVYLVLQIQIKTERAHESKPMFGSRVTSESFIAIARELCLNHVRFGANLCGRGGLGLVWDWTVSRCICALQGTDSGMDTPSREFKADHPIQSYEIVRRCRAGSSVLPTPGEQTWLQI